MHDYETLLEADLFERGRRFRNDAIAHLLIQDDLTPTVSYDTIYLLHNTTERLVIGFYRVCDRGSPPFLGHQARLTEHAKVFWDTYFAGMVCPSGLKERIAERRSVMRPSTGPPALGLSLSLLPPVSLTGRGAAAAPECQYTPTSAQRSRANFVRVGRNGNGFNRFLIMLHDVLMASTPTETQFTLRMPRDLAQR
jgi:hypothetical protein